MDFLILHGMQTCGDALVVIWTLSLLQGKGVVTEAFNNLGKKNKVWVIKLHSVECCKVSQLYRISVKTGHACYLRIDSLTPVSEWPLCWTLLY